MESESLLPTRFLLFIFAFLAALSRCINAEILKSEEYEYDRVIKLPGQPTAPKIAHFSGYITVNEAHGRALFYWFFEAQAEPLKKPLLLWLNGGPGCSSIGYGAAVELGPLRVGKNGVNLEFNQHSWNQVANLLFVESPIGVGFSYTNTSSDFAGIDDGFVAEDTYSFLVKWLKQFPQYNRRDFFISGESYAGHYVPQLAELVYERNKNRSKYPYINLKGFIVGNPETNDYLDYKGLLEYAWSHSVISDQDYDNAKRACDFKLENWSAECVHAMTVVFNRYKEIDIYNVYAPSCLLHNASAFVDNILTENDYSKTKIQSHGFRRMKPGPGGYDPCYSKYAEAYFNRVDVQNALHVSSRGRSDTIKWKVCNDTLFRTYNYTVLSVLPIYQKLIKGGLRIWIYSGDADGRVPVIGSRYSVEALELAVRTPWRVWYYNHQVGGRVVEYEGLTFVTVRGAGHLMPLNKPEEALVLIRSYLSDVTLPSHR